MRLRSRRPSPHDPRDFKCADPDSPTAHDEDETKYAYSDTACVRQSHARKPRSSNVFRIMNESPWQLTYGTLLLFGLFALALNPWNVHVEQPGAGFRQGMWALLVFLSVYSVLNTRDGLLRNPHPGFWRMLHGWNLWYCMIATVILVIPTGDGVVVMGWIFPAVDSPKTPAVEGTLGLDHLTCSITWENVVRQLCSIWFLAHCLGWWAKMLMLRNLGTCLVYSTFFELSELSLQFLVPEFQECWWDSMILDWLLANLLIGMMAGKLTLASLKTKLSDMTVSYDWAPHPGNKREGVVCRAKHTFRQLTPGSWSEYHWNPANDPVTLVLNCVVWMIMAVAEVNSFFLINILHLPRNHPFNYIRQSLLCLLAVPACEEWYEYTRHARAHMLGKEWFEYTTQFKGRKPRIGHSCWLMGMTVIIETMAVIKYGISLGHVKNARPGPEIWLPWAASLSLFTTYFALHCWFFYGKQRTLPTWLRVLKWSSFLPLMFLCRLYAF